MIQNELLSFDDLSQPSKTMFVKEKGGEYRVATTKELLNSARNQVGRILNRKNVLNQPSDVKRFIHAKLSGLEHEVFACLFLNAQLALIDYQEMFSGTIDQASVYPREVAKVALRLNASSVIICHNHPSGFSKPSNADIQLTKRLQESLDLFNIRLLDHILVAGARCISFAEAGHM